MSQKIFTSFQGRKIPGNVKRPGFIFSNLLLPLVVLTLYFVSFDYLLSHIWLLPDGVNYGFVNRSWKYLSTLTAGISLLYLVFYLYKKNSSKSLPKTYAPGGIPFSGTFLAAGERARKGSAGDLLLLLLPLTPVVQYIINNQEILSPLDSLYAIAFFLFLSGLYIFAIPLLFGFAGPARIWMFLGLAFAHTLTSMAMLSSNFNWYEQGSLKIQWTFFTGVFLVSWVLSNLNDKRVLRFLVVAIFLANSASQLLSPGVAGGGVDSLPVADNSLLSHIEGKTPVYRPGIYLLVYDAYVPNETMLAYGIDNSAQEEYLKDTGFVLYPQTYSIGSYSVATMSRVLNASTDLYGSPRRGVSGDGVVQDALKRFGYETYGIFSSDFFFQGDGSRYDVSFPERNPSLDILKTGILMGEFRFDLGFSKTSGEEFLETKRSVFEGASADPAFVYMHTASPGHSQNSGACRPDETELFAERLSRANLEMRQDIETITENDPAAVVIVAGDHGPYLTKNCTTTEDAYRRSEISRLDVQDRYGTFLAILWPTEDFAPYDDITVLQDVFPAVFAYLFQDAGILGSKVESLTLEPQMVSGVTVRDNLIHGGIDDGEPLFLTER